MSLIVGNNIMFGLLATIGIVSLDTILRNLKIGLIYPDTLGIVFGILFGILFGEHYF